MWQYAYKKKCESRVTVTALMYMDDEDFKASWVNIPEWFQKHGEPIEAEGVD